ncbi:hypothetical protein CFIO01_07458 [Colletotrichum fioriniae PJ7]|uniref:Uncharacterized protein n=1 Tax=Colletotrichum fioriniae PJ7 TaxID=1445577 RepID=A0A010QWY5_9PEZI|nr:hypothetical protein CFIO01_07458 [Colletotrichum fioriniae PJ7]
MSSLELMVQAASQHQEGSMGGGAPLALEGGGGRGKKRPVNKSLLNTGRVTSTHHLSPSVSSLQSFLQEQWFFRRDISATTAKTFPFFTA